MKYAERQTRSHLMDLFQRHGFHPRTDLGQNFLIDLNLVDYVVQKAEIGPQDLVLEIGAGTGGMTTLLAELAGAVVSVEVDPRMYKLAQSVVAGYTNVTLLNCDALKNKNRFSPQVLDAVRERLAEDPHRSLKLVANLPYSIATPVISNLVATNLPWTMMVVTIQWELAERMRAAPHTNDYGSLSVWLQSQCQVKVLKKIGPTVFWPRPQVDSAIVRITPDHELKRQLADPAFFHDFIRRLFNLRRKALRGVLVGMYSQQLTKSEVDAVLQPFDLKTGTRAEELDVPTLVRLSAAVSQAVRGRGVDSEETTGLDAT